MDEKWREQIRTKMDGLKRTAPDVAWPEIDKALAKRRAKTTPLFGYKGRWTAAAAMALLVIGGAGLWFHESQPPQTDLVKNAIQRQHDIMGQEKGHLPQGSYLAANDRTEPDGGQTAAALDKGRTAIAEDSGSDRQAEAEPLRICEEGTPVCTAEQEAQPVGNDSSTSVRHTDNSKSMRQGNRAKMPTNRHVYTAAGHKAASGISVQPSLYLGNALAGDGRQPMNSSIAMASDAMQRNDVYGEEIVMGSNKNTLYYDFGTEDSKHHDLPVRVGLNIRVNIGNRWSVESGLNYTYLRSTFTRESDTYQERRVQKLHYIGIPLTVSHSLWRNRHVNVYLSAGTMAELLAKGRMATTYTAYDELQDADQETVSSHRLQWSLNGAMGVEWTATKNIGLYAEPGVGYYLDNHDGIDNRYKDKPWVMNLNMGLRLSFR